MTKLPVAVTIGELIPFKGVMFEVLEITPDRLILTPKGFTGKRMKELKRSLKTLKGQLANTPRTQSASDPVA